MRIHSGFPHNRVGSSCVNALIRTAVWCLLLLLWQVFPAVSYATTISAPTTISATDVTYDGQPLIVDGTTLTIDGAHTFTSLDLINGAKLTHSFASSSASPRLELTIQGTMNIDVNSSVDVSGTATQNLPQSSQVIMYAGGSYGGSGGLYTYFPGSVTNPVYGNEYAPIDFGTWGHSNYGWYSNGGGAVKIVAGTLILDGMINSNGGSCLSHGSIYGSCGGGSGGSIWLDVGTISGTGYVQANGGAGNYYSWWTIIGGGGGGGGRIAIDYVGRSRGRTTASN